MPSLCCIGAMQCQYLTSILLVWRSPRLARGDAFVAYELTVFAVYDPTATATATRNTSRTPSIHLAGLSLPRMAFVSTCYARAWLTRR